MTRERCIRGKCGSRKGAGDWMSVEIDEDMEAAGLNESPDWNPRRSAGGGGFWSCSGGKKGREVGWGLLKVHLPNHRRCWMCCDGEVSMRSSRGVVGIIVSTVYPFAQSQSGAQSPTLGNC